MINWEEWQAVGTVALVLTSAGAIAYAGLQLRHERAYRSIANLEKQVELFHSVRYVEARRRLATDRLDEAGKLKAMDADSFPVSALEVLDFYEHLGLLERKGHLDVEDLWHTFYEWAQPVYSDVLTVIGDEEGFYREQYFDLRRLMHAMHRIQREKMKSMSRRAELWSEERIEDHYKQELMVGGEGLRRRPARWATARNYLQGSGKEEKLTANEVDTDA